MIIYIPVPKETIISFHNAEGMGFEQIAKLSILCALLLQAVYLRIVHEEGVIRVPLTISYGGGGSLEDDVRLCSSISIIYSLV